MGNRKKPVTKITNRILIKHHKQNFRFYKKSMNFSFLIVIDVIFLVVVIIVLLS